MLKSVEKILKKFEEKNSIFDSVDRYRLENYNIKQKVGPPLGKYSPKYEAIDNTTRSVIIRDKN